MAEDPLSEPVPLPLRLENGDLLVPARAEADDGTVGDGSLVVRPGDPGWEAWDAEARRLGR